MDQPHHYHPLKDPHNDSIRLLRLQPSPIDSDNLIACLDEVSLLDDPKYIALSYTWNSPGKKTYTLHIDKHGFLEVRSNVHAVLRRLRSRHEPIAIWIDAICIDQQNLAEKSMQVSRMGRVYRTAREVLVYLGDSDEWTEVGLKAIAMLAEVFDEADLSDVEIDEEMDGEGEVSEYDVDFDESDFDGDDDSSSDEGMDHSIASDGTEQFSGPAVSSVQVEMRMRALQNGVKRKRAVDVLEHTSKRERRQSQSALFDNDTMSHLRNDSSKIRDRLLLLNTTETVDILRRQVVRNSHLRNLWKVGSGRDADSSDMIVDAIEAHIRDLLDGLNLRGSDQTTPSRLGLPFGPLLCVSLFDSAPQGYLDADIGSVPYLSLIRLALLYSFSGDSRLDHEAQRMQYLDLATDDVAISTIRTSIDAPATRSLMDIAKEQLGNELYNLLAECSPGQSIDTTMKALFTIFDRPWFSRVWIQQEIILAKNARVWIGEHTITWERLFSADMFCFSNDLRFGRGVGTCAVLEGKRIMLSDDEDDVPAASTFISHAAYARRIQSTNPRDKVYGWLGLMKEEHSRKIRPDYTVSSAEVFRMFAELLVVNYKSLEILTLRFPGDGDDMPSWVPDLNGKSNLEEAGLGNLRTSYAGFAAAGQSEVKAMVLPKNPKHLLLEGMIVDDVIATSVAFRQRETLGRTALMRKSSIELVITAWASLARRYCPNPYSTGECLTDAFWKTLVQHRGSTGVKFTAEDRTSALQTVVYQFDTELPLPDDIRPEDLEEDLADEVHWRGSPETMLDYMAAQVGSLRFFVTRKGYMGLGYYDIQQGNQVALFSGGRMPFLISNAGTVHRLRSVCYVHGVMSGEVWNAVGRICLT